MASVPYKIVMSDKTLDAITAYKEGIASGRETPGARLQKSLNAVLRQENKATADLSTEQFLQALLATKAPRIFAESEIRGDGSDWTKRELSLLGDINVTMAAKIFDNGVWSTAHPDFKEYGAATPLQGNLLFTPGALLNVGRGFKGQSPDYLEVVSPAGEIDQQKYNQLIERRMLPLLVQANDDAQQSGKPAFITLPGIGCGAFAGEFRGEMGSHLNIALQALLQKHGSQLPHIKAVYLDTFNECKNQQQFIHGIAYRVRPATQNPGKPQLATPQTYAEQGDDFSNCTLYKIVAWDHVSLPGNDFFVNDRNTDDGVSAAATNSMESVTGITGRYISGKYLPPQGYQDWEDVVLRHNLQLTVKGNVNIVTGTAQLLTLQDYQASKPAVQPAVQGNTVMTPTTGIQELSGDVRGFLYNLFNTAAQSFDGATDVVAPGLARARMAPAGSLAGRFQRVVSAARRGTLQEVNDALNDVVQAVNTTTDPVLKDQIEGARLQEQLFYRGWVRNNKQLETALGSYGQKIF